MALDLGWYAELTAQALACRLGGLLTDRRRRDAFARNGRRAFDGYSLARILDAMHPCDMSLRRADRTDCEAIWRWANDPLTRSASMQSEPIALEQHRCWFAQRTRSRDCLFLCASGFSGAAWGSCRFDIHGDEAVVSINLNPAFRAMGIGSRLIREASRRLFLEAAGVRRIRAEIKQRNAISAKAFANAGYRVVEAENRSPAEVIHMQLTAETVHES